MYKMSDVVRKGDRLPEQRLSLVFKVGGRYMLREICPTGRQMHGLQDTHYSFIGTDLYSQESVSEAAVNAGRVWGIIVDPQIILGRVQETGRTRRYVWCTPMVEISETERTYQAPEGPRKMKLMSPEEAINDPQVIEDVKRIILEVEDMLRS